MKYTLILSYTVTFRRSEVKKKISSGIADVTVEYVTSRTSKYKPHAAIMLATKQISIQWKLQLSVSLMLIHLVIYPMGGGYRFPASKQLGPCARVEDIFWLLLMTLFLLY